jgi:hypothetical protein
LPKQARISPFNRAIETRAPVSETQEPEDGCHTHKDKDNDWPVEKSENGEQFQRDANYRDSNNQAYTGRDKGWKIDIKTSYKKIPGNPVKAKYEKSSQDITKRTTIR